MYNRKGITKEIKSMVGRLGNSAVVWQELTKDKMCIVLNTKSKGKKQ
jgi:hypothetical protein